MHNEALALPSRPLLQEHVLSALGRYWPNQQAAILSLPISAISISDLCKVLTLCPITLPEWERCCGVDGVILVPVEACQVGNSWEKVDWWLAAFLMLECWHERNWERRHGPIHSYSFRLKDWDERVWHHAWVNRIGLFLRTWAAIRQNMTPAELFGPLSVARILMTHDVDAVSKTIPTRIKQGAFNFYNALRFLAVGDIVQTQEKFRTALRFMFGMENWWTYDSLLAKESCTGIRAHYNFYADTRSKTLRRWLLDPAYDIRVPKVRNLIHEARKKGMVIGLHPTFDAWDSSETLLRQKEQLESICGTEVTNCRQHWLRFSWERTWDAQQSAGFRHDTTLMFNDRPGFRASAALAWQPWNQQAERPHGLTELPTVMMDSHFYDYRSMTTMERRIDMKKWLDEVRTVGGEIAVLWHPHTLTDDYGWGEGLDELINMISEDTPCHALQ